MSNQKVPKTLGDWVQCKVCNGTGVIKLNNSPGSFFTQDACPNSACVGGQERKEEDDD